MLDENEFLSPHGIRGDLALSQGPSVRFASGRSAIQRKLRAGGIQHQPVRRKFQLARAGLVSGELPHDRIAAALQSLFWGPDAGGVPHRFGREEESGGGGVPCCRAGYRICSCATGMAGGRYSVAPRNSRRDPYFRDHILFYEYFHGDNGAGIGASHQTGWTALVAKLLQQSGE